MLLLSSPRPGASLFGVGDAVFDPTNFAQNVLQVTYAIEETLNQTTQIANEVQMLTNQARQLANEAQMLTNQAKDLTRLPHSVLGPVLESLQQYAALLQGAQGLTYDLRQLQAQYDALYPTFAGQGVRSQDLAQVHAPKWTQQVRTAVQQAMQAQSVITRLVQTERQVETALSSSQAAEGNLQVIQAGNQILSVVATQLAGLEQLLAATGRAQASGLAQDAAADDAARENATQRMGGFSTWTHTTGTATLPQLR
jgi:P-type conjugative transfer protein TrbJ